MQDQEASLLPSLARCAKEIRMARRKKERKKLEVSRPRGIPHEYNRPKLILTFEKK